METLSLAKRTLSLLASCAVYALIVGAITCGVTIFITQDFRIILLYLTYALIVEGALGLIIGGSIASFSPAIGRVSETIFRSKPKDAKQIKESEREGLRWITTGAFLFVAGLAVSAL